MIITSLNIPIHKYHIYQSLYIKRYVNANLPFHIAHHYTIHDRHESMGYVSKIQA